MGNSEVGHLNLGAGSVVKQDLSRIDAAVADGTLLRERGPARRLRAGSQEPTGAPAPARARLRRRRALRLGAHRGLRRARGPRGRPRPRPSTPSPTAATRSPTGGARYIEEVERWLRSAGRIGTVGGRYFAMDRDHRWERTKLAFDALVHAEGLAGRHRRRGDRRRLRGRRHRRVHQADGDRQLRRHAPGRRRDRVQLPARPDAAV